MRIIVIGATGTIGSAISAQLADEHEVVGVARSGADIAADVTDTNSIGSMFQAVGSFDALVCAFGAGAQGGVAELDAESFEIGWRTKVLPQMILVKEGLAHVADGGSFTLSSGLLSKEPAPGLSAVSATNGAVDAFCKAAALEMPRGVRINCVSPVYVIESMEAAGVTDLSGFPVQSAADTAKSYVAAIMGDLQGQDIDARTI